MKRRGFLSRASSALAAAVTACGDSYAASASSAAGSATPSRSSPLAVATETVPIPTSPRLPVLTLRALQTCTLR